MKAGAWRAGVKEVTLTRSSGVTQTDSDSGLMVHLSGSAKLLERHSVLYQRNVCLSFLLPVKDGSRCH